MDLTVITGVFAAVFLAAMFQTVAGFGGALFAMPILTALLGIQTASPSMALITIISTALNMLYWRDHISLRQVMAIAGPAIIAIPLGVFFVSYVDPDLTAAVLGVVLILYAAYGLIGRSLPLPTHAGWAIAVGFTSGLLSGAFNTGGPPVVAYADASRWSAEQFRANLQTFFLISALVAAASHLAAGNYDGGVFRLVLPAVLPIVVGRAVGLRISRRVNPASFRRLVLVMLLILGAQLIIR